MCPSYGCRAADNNLARLRFPGAWQFLGSRLAVETVCLDLFSFQGSPHNQKSTALRQLGATGANLTTSRFL
jgi:hypothetical protein